MNIEMLNEAKRMVDLAERERNWDGTQARATLASAYAAIATAAAAERQAAAMEKVVKLLEMMAPPLNGLYSPDATGYHTEEEFDEALAEYKYRKAQAEAWAKAERGE